MNIHYIRSLPKAAARQTLLSFRPLRVYSLPVSVCIVLVTIVTLFFRFAPPALEFAKCGFTLRVLVKVSSLFSRGIVKLRWPASLYLDMLSCKHLGTVQTNVA